MFTENCTEINSSKITRIDLNGHPILCELTSLTKCYEPTSPKTHRLQRDNITIDQRYYHKNEPQEISYIDISLRIHYPDHNTLRTINNILNS